jgi:hypothetical protein
MADAYLWKQRVKNEFGTNVKAERLTWREFYYACTRQDQDARELAGNIIATLRDLYFLLEHDSNNFYERVFDEIYAYNVFCYDKDTCPDAEGIYNILRRLNPIRLNSLYRDEVLRALYDVIIYLIQIVKKNSIAKPYRYYKKLF